VFDTSGRAIAAAPALGTFTVLVPLAGDANRDGTVNFGDFEILRRNFGRTQASWDAGDFNGDGVVSFADFQILEANFGKSQPAVTPGAASIPSGVTAVAAPRAPVLMARVARAQPLN
jgi:hypothetical protein